MTKLNYISPLLLTVALSLVSVSCAIAPAGLERKTSHIDQDICSSSLEQLLPTALEEPDTGLSAHALAHFVERWKLEKGNTASDTLEIVSGDGASTTYHLTFDDPGQSGFPLHYFDEIEPAVDFSITKLPIYKREGVGAPLLAQRENRGRQPIERYYPPELIATAVTALIKPGLRQEKSRQVTISLLSPLHIKTVQVQGKAEPLAADFTVPWAALLSRAGDLNSSRRVDLLRTQPKRDPQLYLMEPYDPRKTPLLMIHGLISTPLVWAEISNELWGDEFIRQKYQLWHYLYNTSAPPMYSGRVLQQQLLDVRELLDPEQNDPAMQSMTIVAHSMGGLVTRRLTTEPGDVFWNAAFTQPIDTLTLSEQDRGTLEKAFFWKADEQIDQAIFIAVPHRGSHYADSPIGKFGQILVRPPVETTEFYHRISAANPGIFTPEYAQLGQGKLDSVSELSPRKPTVNILSALPDRYQVETHSIIGNQGEVGPIEKSSDGVVDYWSSHLPNARSETIVPIEHSDVNHKEVLGAIKRILKQNPQDYDAAEAVQTTVPN